MSVSVCVRQCVRACVRAREREREIWCETGRVRSERGTGVPCVCAHTDIQGAVWQEDAISVSVVATVGPSK